MKYLISLLLLPALALAQPPGDQPQPPSFEKFKQTMLPVLKESLPPMKKTRACLSKADTKSDVEECMKTMADMARAMQKRMGMPKGAKQPPPGIGKPPKGFEWNAKTKANMLGNMDRSIAQSSAMLECLGKSNTGDEMKSCMRAKIPAHAGH